MGLIVGPAICIGSTLQNNSSVSYFETEAEYIYRKSGGSDAISSGKATMSSIKGKSLVWGQFLAKLNSDGSKTADGVTITDNRDGSYTVSTDSGGATANVTLQLKKWLQPNPFNGHKVLFSGIHGGSQTTYHFRDIYSGLTGYVGEPTIVSIASDGRIDFCIRVATGAIITTPVTVRPQIFDLTLMFGAGNEPTTVADFEAMYPLPYYDYNAGEIVSNKATALETVGFNQWDEEWENGSIEPTTGVPASNSDYIRPKNYIPIIGGASYYINRPNATGHLNAYIYYYDRNKNFLGRDSRETVYNTTGKIFTAPTSAFYAKFTIQYATYNHDICINLSDPAKNGTYHPYEKHTLTLNLPTLTGKLNGEGTSVVIAPEGMAGQDDWADLGIVEDGYLTKVIKKTPRVEVDLGDLTWSEDHPTHRFYSLNFTSAKAPASNDVAANIICSKFPTISAQQIFRGAFGIALSTGNAISASDIGYDSATAATFKTAMSGVKLIHELATPETYVLDNPVYVSYKVISGGTEERLPRDTASSVTAPIKYSVKYIQPKE